MAEHNDLGKLGEELANEHLIEKGYKIIHKNWRFGSDEIDIIASIKDIIVIVEVKTRKSNVFAEPEDSVTKAKQKFLIRAADAYINQRNIDKEVRFDVISIILNGTEKRIYHIEDAFYPTVR